MKRFLKNVRVASTALVAAATLLGLVACEPSVGPKVPQEPEVPVASAKADAVKPEDLPATDATKFISSDDDFITIMEGLSAIMGGISGGDEFQPEFLTKAFREFDPSTGLPEGFPFPPTSEPVIELDEETQNFVEKITELVNSLNGLEPSDDEEKFTADIKFNEKFGAVDLAALIASTDSTGKFAPIASLLDLKLNNSTLKLVFNADLDNKTKSGKVISEGKAKGNIALKIKDVEPGDESAEEGMMIPVYAAALNFDFAEYVNLAAAEGKFSGNASAAGSVNFGTSFALPVDEETMLGGKIIISANSSIKTDDKLLEKFKELSLSDESDDEKEAALMKDLSNYLTEILNIDVTVSVYDDNNKSTYSKKLTKDQLIKLFGSLVKPDSKN